MVDDSSEGEERAERNTEVARGPAKSSDSDATRVRPRFDFSVDGYQLTQVLGEGGMGRVYLAWDARLERKVAIKTMTGNVSGDADFRERFAKEGIIVANLDHSNIVKVYGSGETQGTVYIIMQYASGGSLAEELEKGSMDPAEATEIARCLAAALSYSHSLGIVHRDIKPQNILFTADRVALLSDFGIAKALLSDVQQTATGMVIGDPRYMSPEQILGEADEKTDVYNLGLVLYEMLCGEPPQKSFKAIRSEDNARQLQQSLPPKLKKYARVLIGSLQADPEQRYSAEELVCELDKFRETSAGSNRALVVAVVVLTLLTLGYAGFTFYGPDTSVGVQRAQITFPLSLQPPESRLYIDGDRVDPGTELKLAAGNHEFVAVAKDHIGESGKLDVTQASEGLQLILKPLGKPTDEEFREFSQYIVQTFSPEAPIPVFQHDTFNRLARLKALVLSRNTAELAALVNALKKLAERGDAAAQTILFYATYKEWIPENPMDYLAGLEDASRQNYVLASIYLGLYFIDSDLSNMMRDTPERSQVLSLLSLIESQGMPQTAATLRAHMAM